jgi:hydroxymethylglutaryl-CoA reductase
MRLHARNIAAMAGAKGDLIDIVAKRIVEENNININHAKEILESLLRNTK